MIDGSISHRPNADEVESHLCVCREVLLNVIDQESADEAVDPFSGASGRRGDNPSLHIIVRPNTVAT
jgi:hypothetical protein